MPTARTAVVAAATVMLLAGTTSVRVVGARQTPSPAVSEGAVGHEAVVKRYCASCHSQQRHSGGVVLEGIDLAAPARSAETLEKAVRKLRTGTMPPPGAPRP